VKLKIKELINILGKTDFAANFLYQKADPAANWNVDVLLGVYRLLSA